jgi:predicted enzyme related to lactoylglutathione lyase
MAVLRICIDVPDLDQGIEFYVHALGLTLFRRHGAELAELVGAGCPVDLLCAEAGSNATPLVRAVRSYERHWTPVHLDLEVEDLEGAVERAVAAGARLERPITRRPFGRLAILGDPFGHGLCLVQFEGHGYGELVPPSP